MVETQESKNSLSKEEKYALANKYIIELSEKEYGENNSLFLNNFSEKNFDENWDKFRSRLFVKLKGEGINNISMDDLEKDPKYEEILKTQVARLGLPLISKRKNLKTIIDDQYTIKNDPRKEKEKKLEKTIENLGITEINELISSENKRDSFLVKALGGKKGEEFDKKGLNELIWKVDIDWNTLSNQQKDAINAFHDKKGTLYSDDILDILPLFSRDQKIKILRFFATNISLQELLDNGIIEKKAAKLIIEDLLKKEKLPYDDNIIKSLRASYRDIIIPTENLSYSDENIDKIINIKSGDIADTINEMKKGVLETEKTSGIKGLESFRSELSNKSNVINANNFANGRYIEITETITKSSGGTEDLKTYLKIIKPDVKDGYGFSYEERGRGVAINTRDTSQEYVSYTDFLNKVVNRPEVKEMKIYTSAELDNAIEDGTVKSEKGSAYSLKDPNYLQEKSDSLNEQLKSRKENLKKLRAKEGLATLEEDYEKDPEIIKLKEQIEDLDNQVNDIDTANLTGLIRAIDDLDPTGSAHGIREGTVFEIEGGDGLEIYSIKTVEPENKVHGPSLTLTNGDRYTFVDFYQAFERSKAKRKTIISNHTSLIGELSKLDKIGDDWKNFEIADGDLVNKNYKGKKGYDGVKFLASTKEDIGCKIESIEGDIIKVRHCEIKKEETKNKAKDGKKIKKDVYHYSNKVEQITTAQFYGIVRDYKMQPKDNPPKEKIKDTDPGFHGSFISKLTSMYSIAELIAGGKLGIDAIQNHLKKGNDEHAARFALGFFGKILPEELEKELQIKVESTQKESQDAIVEQLKKIDSPAATKLILKRLQNKDEKDYKKEGAMIFMYQEYGVLYAKELAPYRGTNLWYKAMGGKIGDEAWNWAMDDSKKQGQPFTEELAVYYLMKKQCGDKPFNGIKRRSRLHKEVKGLWPKGIQAEREKGKGDAHDIRSINGINSGGFGEMIGGTNPNAFGWIEEAAGRGGTLQQTYYLPFIFMFSGAANITDDRVRVHMRNSIGIGVPMLRFCHNEEDTNLFKRVVVDLSKKISEEHKDKHGEMGKLAKEIFLKSDNISSKGDLKDNLEKTKSFWEDHGEPLVRALHMLNGVGGEYESTDKTILIEKQDIKDEKGNNIVKGNEDYQTYFKKLLGWTDEEFDFSKKDYMGDRMKGQGMSGMNTFSAVGDSMKTVAGGAFKIGTGSDIWDEIKREINGLKTRRYHSDDTVNYIIKKKLLVDLLRDLTFQLRKDNSGAAARSLGDPGNIIGGPLLNMGINLFEGPLAVSYEKIKSGELDNEIREIADGILTGNIKKVYSKEKNNSIIDSMKGKVDTTINNRGGGYTAKRMNEIMELGDD